MTESSRRPSPLWISEADVVDLLDMRQAIEALEWGLSLEAAGEAANLEKTYVAAGAGSTLHALGAAFSQAGITGTKTWTQPEGSTSSPLLILWDSADGSLLAVIEASALGQLRTGGIGGLATKWLAREDGDEMAIIGSGAQALAQVGAVAAIRDLRRLSVFSPNPESRRRFAEKLRGLFDFPVLVASSVAEAVEGAGIVTLATAATEPFLAAAMVAPGTHINAVGSTTPAKAEVRQDIFARCHDVVADSVASARRFSAELREYFGTDEQKWSQIRPLSEVIRQQRRRDPAADLTLFKAMGMGIGDVALGAAVLKKAVELGVGGELPARRRLPPRFTRTPRPPA